MAAWSTVTLPSLLAVYDALEYIQPTDLVSPTPPNSPAADLGLRTEAVRTAANTLVDAYNDLLDYFHERDGASTTMFMRGDLDMGGNKVTDLLAATEVNDLERYGRVEALYDRVVVVSDHFTNQEILLVDGSLAMQANLSLGSQQIKNLDAGTADTDAVTKAQVDAQFAAAALGTTYQDRLGNGTRTGAVVMGGNKVINLTPGAPITGDWLASKEYVDSKFLSLAAPDPYPVGVVLPYAGTSTTAPSGWTWCDGRELLEAQFPELYAITGRVFGGSALAQTFAVPDLRGRVVAGIDPGVYETAQVSRLRVDDGGAVSLNTWAGTRGGSGGTSRVGLQNTQHPAHSHDFDDRTTGIPGSTGGLFPAPSLALGGSTLHPTHSGVNGSMTETAGAGNSHENLQSTIVLGWIVKVAA